MNISISNWHNSSFDSTKMKFFTSFQFFTRLLTSNHFNLISTYLVGRKGVMWKTCFSASQNAKNESQLKHKNQVRNRLFVDMLNVGTPSPRSCICGTPVWVWFIVLFVLIHHYPDHDCGYCTLRCEPRPSHMRAGPSASTLNTRDKAQKYMNLVFEGRLVIACIYSETGSNIHSVSDSGVDRSL